MTNTQLLAGAAMVDITPRMGVQIDGDIGRYRPVEEVREPIYARALVLESGGTRCCFLSLDLLAITNPFVAEIRRQAAAFGLAPEAVVVHVVQNHAAPSIGHIMLSDDYFAGRFPDELWYLRGGDTRYNPVAMAGVMRAIEEACGKMRPVTVAVGRGTDGRVAFNRRFVLRDGTARTHPPPCDPNILYCEGPIDPEVSVMTFTGADGKAVATLLHHTCHPVHGYPLRYISHGWPGAWAEGVRALYGPQCIPLVVNGACGNVHHRNHLDPDQHDDYAEMGRKLTETVAKILPRMEPVAQPTLNYAGRALRIPLRELDEEEMAKAEQLLAAHPTPIWKDDSRTAIEWDWIYAHALHDLRARRARRPYYPYEVQALRVGDAALLALIGEPFVEAQLEIKLASPARYTFLAHMSNGYVGYIPTRAAFARGGYETRTGNGSQLVPAALETITAASLDLLRALYAHA